MRLFNCLLSSARMAGALTLLLSIQTSAKAEKWISVSQAGSACQSFASTLLVIKPDEVIFNKSGKRISLAPLAVAASCVTTGDQVYECPLGSKFELGCQNGRTGFVLSQYQSIAIHERAAVRREDRLTKAEFLNPSGVTVGSFVTPPLTQLSPEFAVSSFDKSYVFALRGESGVFAVSSQGAALTTNEHSRFLPISELLYSKMGDCFSVKDFETTTSGKSLVFSPFTPYLGIVVQAEACAPETDPRRQPRRNFIAVIDYQNNVKLFQEVYGRSPLVAARRAVESFKKLKSN